MICNRERGIVMKLSGDKIEKFWKDGYLLVPGVFSEQEIEAYRGEALRLRANPANYATSPETQAAYFPGTLSNYKKFEGIIFDDRLLGIAKSILGKQIAYYGESSFQMGKGSRRFHRDNGDRNNVFTPDWEGVYPLIRLGIYLGDYSRQSGGLKIVP